MRSTPADPGAPRLRDQQREAARRAAQAADGNLSLAARQLGISRTTLYKLLRD
ncbi:helix-turn-helix domain-containing protein [Stenotrophomonas sp. CD2]|nr:helix-turn-helix domain-containing protein [Stenotrophomonas sp. CD2]